MQTTTSLISRLVTLVGLLVGLTNATLSPTAAEIYQIDRDVIVGGGGGSASTAYQLIGSFGQASPPASMSNGAYIINGGFWGGGTAAPLSMYTLTVVIQGEGMVSAPGIACPGDCNEDFPEGASLSLNQTAEPCRHFVKWLVDGESISGPIVVNRDITVTAVFEYCCPAPLNSLTPAEDATEQPLDVELAWNAADDATSYSVSFGTTSPAPYKDTVTGVSYDPGPLEIATTYYWKIDAVNSCGTVFGAERQFTTTANHPPLITSIPPLMVNRTYQYDVEASDPDGDPLTFSLTNAPDGMTINAVTGKITWTAAPTQTGTFTPSVKASDDKGGVSDPPQPIPLEVTADTFITATVKFYEGFDSEQGATEIDRTVLTFTPGNSDTVDEISWPPGVSELFTFSGAVQLYFEHVPSANGPILLRLAGNVEAALINGDTSGNPTYTDVTYATIASLSLTPWTNGQHVRAEDTVVMEVTQDSVTRYVKLGNFTVNAGEWMVNFQYEELQAP